MIVEKLDEALCHIPWFRMMIRVDGLVHVCCYNLKEMGCIREQSLSEIWEGDKYNAVRQSITDKTFDQGCTESCPIVSELGISRPSEGSGGLPYERGVLK